MMRCPIGSFPAPSSTRNMPPAMRVFGTMSASTTLIHGDHLMAEKYCAACLISSSVMFFANEIMRFVLAFRASELFLLSFLKSIMVCTKYEYGRPDTPAFSGRPLPFGSWHRLQ